MLCHRYNYHGSLLTLSAKYKGLESHTARLVVSLRIFTTIPSPYTPVQHLEIAPVFKGGSQYISTSRAILIGRICDAVDKEIDKKKILQLIAQDVGQKITG